MAHKLARILLALLVGAALGGIMACDRSGPAEQAQKKMDEAASKMDEAASDMGKAASDMVEKEKEKAQ